MNPSLGDLESATWSDYDIRGRVVEQSLMSFGEVVEVDEVAATTTTEYAGPVTTVTSPTGSVSKSTVDILGRLVRQQQCESASVCGALDGIVTEYDYVTLTQAMVSDPAYEGVGFQKVTVTDAEDNDTVFVSNLAGQRTYMSDPNSGESTYLYDDNGRTTWVDSETGVIRMGYDTLGRMTVRRTFETVAAATAVPDWTATPSGHWQSETVWEYVDDALDGPVGALETTVSTSRVDVGVTREFETTSTVDVFDVFGRPKETTVVLPESPEGTTLLGDLSGYAYTTSVSYDPDTGVVTGSTLPPIGGLPEEVVSTGYRLNGMAQTLTLKAPGVTPSWSTVVVTGTSVDGTGLFESRTYGNGVVRGIGWDTVSRAPEVISASFDYLDGGNPATAYLQSDELTRDVAGRVTVIDDQVLSSAQCYTYDGFNRLDAAWTTGDPCGNRPVAPSTSWLVGDPTSATYAASYATEWDYSDSGRIESIVNLAADGSQVTSAYTYPTSGPVHAVSGVGEVTSTVAVDEFTSGTYSAGVGVWATNWVETGDDADPAAGLISTSDGVLWLEGVVGTDPDGYASRTVTTTDMTTGSVELGFNAAGQALEADDVVTVTLIPDGEPLDAVSTVFSGEEWTVASSPDWEEGATVESVDLSAVLPADTVEIRIGVTSGVEDGTGETREKVLVTGVTVTMDSASKASGAYTYDGAGRMETRTVDDGAGDVTTTFTWDVSSNLVTTVETNGDTFLYLYDGSGQRVLKVRLDDPDTTEEYEGTATAYVGSTEVTDADTSINADLITDPSALEDATFVTGTRFYTFGGATVAVRKGNAAFDDSLSLLLGDHQGSASILMPVHLDPTTKAILPATLTDAQNATRNAYLPYGATRGGDLLSIEHGWLNQVTDESDTGLIYLNARYYDPVLSRFLSPDPIINTVDPKTLDPYRYADNNPVLFQDASGLAVSCGGLAGDAWNACNGYASTYQNPNGFTYRPAIQRGRDFPSARSVGEANRQPKVGSPEKFPMATWPIDFNSVGETGQSSWQVANNILGTLLTKNGDWDHWNDEATVSLELWAIEYAARHGGEVYLRGPACGSHMVCFVGVSSLPTTIFGMDFGNKAITFGRITMTTEEQMGARLQFHEYVHVIQYMAGGAERFINDYYRETFIGAPLSGNMPANNKFEVEAESKDSRLGDAWKDWLKSSNLVENGSSRGYQFPHEVQRILLEPNYYSKDGAS